MQGLSSTPSLLRLLPIGMALGLVSSDYGESGGMERLRHWLRDDLPGGNHSW